MNDFAQLINDIDAEARAEGPEAVAQLCALEARFMLAADLIALRQASGLSQEQLAKASGVQQADISRIERGIVTPTIGTIEKLVQPLGAQVRMLPRGGPQRPDSIEGVGTADC